LLRTFLCALLGACYLYAQTTSTQILGSVVDQSNAAIAGASIEAVRKSTGEKRTAATNETGNYILLNLESGDYELTISAPGFQSERIANLRLELNQRARVDVNLKVGSVTDAIEVTALAPVLNTDDATIGEVVSRKQIVELPLNGRSFAQLATIAAPGVRTGYQGFANGVRLYAGGQRENQNQFSLSGIVVQNNLINSVSFRPSVEALEEFKVQTGNFTAEYGMYSGAQVTMNLRSGSNELHGTLFEFLRNEKMDARNFFENPANPKAPLRRNQFGFVVSGPVYIPKLYDGRNKTFFMVNSEYVRERRTGVGGATVPPNVLRQGNFSGLSTPIIDPLTHQPFPGNVIPQNRINQASLALQEYYPAANQPGSANYLARTRTDTDNDQFLTRIDQIIGDKDRLYGSFIRQTNEIRSQAQLPTDLRVEPNTDWSAALNETHIFSPNVVNEFRLGYTRLKFENRNNFTGSDFSIQDNFGMLGFPENDPFTAGLPTINVTGYLSLSSYGPLFQVDETAQLVNNLSIVTGRHVIKFGYDARKGRIARRASNWPRGDLNFTGEITGNAYADFLLGLPRRSNGVENLNYAEARNWRHGAFIADEWKVNNRLTLNLGLRYELFTVPVDPYGRLRTLDPNDLTRLVPEPYVSAKLFNGDHNNFAPRIGFALRPFGSKTVFRGGYGIYYNANQLNNFTLLQSNPPFKLVPTILSDPLNPTVSINNPYLSGGSLPTGPFNIVAVDTSLNLPSPYTQNYSFLIQQEILPNTTFEVGYVGAQTKHIDRAHPFNTALPGPGPIQPRRPVPTWADIRMIRNDVSSNYNSLQSTLRKRTSNGLTLIGTYAWSKTIDDGNDFNSGARIQDPHRRDLDRGRSQFDFTHRLTASFVYELPFFARSSGVTRFLLGGWQVNGIYLFETGRPFSIAAGGDIANTGSPNQRADRLADGRLPSSERTLQRWFDTSAFARPQLYTYGNSGRHILDGPNTNTIDFGAVKNFAFAERHNVQFRAEFFSLTNTPNFGLPGSTVGTPAFGVITSATNNRNVQLGLKYSF
jgi:Carboxypeptidase regulatory-like domain/TonB dependent receptor